MRRTLASAWTTWWNAWPEVPVEPSRLTGRDLAVLLGLLAFGLWMLAPGLGHPGIHDWDESLHQAAARGTYDSFFFPHLWSDPLYPVDPAHWWGSGVWLHKPVLPLWYAALVMKGVGVTPLALRSGALLGQLLAAAGAYWLARHAAGRFWAGVGALGFLALPFGWVLTQGLIFGDAYDCLLVGWVTLTVVLLVQAVERDSYRWAVAAGVALGLAHLTKTMLALAPLGIAVVLVLLRWLRFSKGLRWGQLVAFGAAALAVTGPWNLYAFLQWPEVYRAGATLAFGHILESSGADVGGWRRPVDAIFNEMLATGYGPLPVIVPIAGALWLLVRAVWKREPAVLITALWVWSTWVTHSMVSAKAPGHVWNAAPAALVGLALLARDVWRYPAAAGLGIAALFTSYLMPWLPWLGKVRQWVPAALPQTRTVPGLAEGLVLILFGALLGYLLWRLLRRSVVLSSALAALYCVALLWWLGFKLPEALKAQPEARKRELLTSYTQTLGEALDRLTPKRSVLFQNIERDPPGSFEVYNSMFWSGRMTYRRAPDLPLSREKGYHPYLVSSTAEPYAPVEGVPAHAWLRAYDLEKPASPPPIPAGATPLHVQVDGLNVLGFATGPLDAQHDGWVFFVRPEAVPGGLRLVFTTSEGEWPAVQPEPEDALRSRQSLAGVAWYVLPTLGPPRAKVKAIDFGAARHRVELAEAISPR